MVPLELARRLRDAGLVWSPAAGDAFAVPDRDLDEEVFHLADMVVEVLDVPGGSRLLAFNGTTEWALDSVDADDAVWLPREDQLREVLGDRFVALERLDGDQPGYAVVVHGGDGPQRHVDVSPVAAYARAVLRVLTGT